MGMYGWLSEDEFERYSRVTDEELNEILQEVRLLMPNVYIGEHTHFKQAWFKAETIVTYSIYSRTDNFGSDNEVRILNLKTTNKDYVANYLFGLLNGYRAAVVYITNRKS